MIRGRKLADDPAVPVCGWIGMPFAFPGSVCLVLSCPHIFSPQVDMRDGAMGAIFIKKPHLFVADSIAGDGVYVHIAHSVSPSRREARSAGIFVAREFKFSKSFVGAESS